MNPIQIARVFFQLSVKFITSYILLSTVLAAGLSVGIWFFGDRIRLAGYAPLESELHRIIAICLVVACWIIGNLIVYLGRPKKRRKEQPVEEIQPVDPVQIQVEQFENWFDNAIKNVEEKWKGRGRSTQIRNELPWYITLGFPGCGKTTLIAESQLKFPLAHLFGQENYKRVEPTHQADCWVTNDALIFDLSGRFVNWGKPSANSKNQTISEYEKLWESLQGRLNKYRPRRPINGVILCIDLLDLIQSSDEVRTKKASVIHSRLVQLSETLGTRYTVHVVLTKIDLVDGFREFFSILPQSRRSALLGHSFKFYRESDDNGWQSQFSKSFQDFLGRVNEFTIDAIKTQRDTQSRQKTFLFSRSLAGLHEILEEFLGTALHSDNFTLAPLVRGVFFSSARQEGIPSSPVIATAAKESGMRLPVLSAHSAYSKPYFSEALLPNFVFKEAGLAGDNLKVEMRKRATGSISLVSGALATLIIGIFYMMAYDDNLARAQTVLDKVTIFKATSGALLETEEGAASQTVSPAAEMLQLMGRQPIGTAAMQAAQTYQAGFEFLGPLDGAYSALSEFKYYRERTHIDAFMTLYQGKRIGPEVEKAYIALLEDRFLPSVTEFVGDRVALLGNDPAKRDSDERLEALRTYLMLGDLSKRDSDVIRTWMIEVWRAQFEGNENVQTNLVKHLSHAIDDFSLAADLDENLIADAQNDLRRVPRDLRLFRNIESLASRQLVGGINFRNEIGPAFNVIFEGNIEGQDASAHFIPSLYTKEAFHSFFVPQNESLSQIAVEDAWVAGERDTTAYSDEDLQSFEAKVLQRYTSNYVSSWQDSLNALDVVAFDNVDHAVKVLEEISGSSIPFQRLLTLVSDNTNLYDIKTIELEREQAQDADLPFNDEREQGLRIARAFNQLSTLVEAEDGEKPYIEDLTTALTSLYNYMKEISQAGPRSGEVALLKVKDRVALKGNDPIYLVQRLGVDLPAPFDRFFAKLADQSWKVILEEAQTSLQTSWRDQIYSRYNLYFAPRYPFNPEATEEVDLQEFEQFFGPNGEIDSFFKENLALFIDDATGRPKIIGSRQMDISPEFVSAFNRAFELRDSFFDSKGLLSLRYTLEPQSLSGGVNRAVMDIEGQLVPYAHGPRRPINILWPNVASGRTASRLSVFRGRSQPQTITYDGPWSSFRLIDEGIKQNITKDTVDLVYILNRSQVRYRLRVTERENPFLTRPLAKLALPEKL